MGPWLYGVYASKDKFSRELLLERLQAGTAALPTGSELSDLAANSTLDVDQITEMGSRGAAHLVETIPQGEAFDWLVAMTGENAKALTDVLYQTHDVAIVWYIMGVVGVVSALGIYIYGLWILKLARDDRAAAE